MIGTNTSALTLEQKQKQVNIINFIIENIFKFVTDFRSSKLRNFHCPPLSKWIFNQQHNPCFTYSYKKTKKNTLLSSMLQFISLMFPFMFGCTYLFINLLLFSFFIAKRKQKETKKKKIKNNEYSNIKWNKQRRKNIMKNFKTQHQQSVLVAKIQMKTKRNETRRNRIKKPPINTNY